MDKLVEREPVARKPLSASPALAIQFFLIPLAVVAVTAGIWVHLSSSHMASSRYALTIALLTMSSAAMGIIGTAQWVAVKFANRRPARETFSKTVVVSLVVMGIVGWADSLSSDMRSRNALASLGRWLHAEFGAARSVSGSESQLSLGSV